MIDSFLEEVKRGREGKNQGYSIGLPKLEGMMDGLTRATITLIFGATGTGKTSSMLYSYVYRPAMDHLEDGKFEVLMFALEMGEVMLKAKLLSIYLKETYNYTLTAKEILGRKKGRRLSDNEYQMIVDSMPWMNKLMRIIHIVEKKVSAKGAYADILKFLEKNGTFTDKENHTGYVPNDPEKTLLTVTDHLGLLRVSAGNNKKGEIDDYSSMQVSIRNRTGMSFVNLMQVNRASSDMNRKKLGYNEPILEDIKESGNPSEDSDVVLGLYSPIKDHLANYRDYDIKKLDDHCKSIICLKNRYGESDKADVCYFDGATGIFKELPKPEEINDYDHIFDNIIPSKEQDTEFVDNKVETNKLEFVL